MLLQSTARAVLLSRRGTLSEQLSSVDSIESASLQRRPLFPLNAKDWVKERLTTVLAGDLRKASVSPAPGLEFPNGLGGFTENGTELFRSFDSSTVLSTSTTAVRL